VELLKQQAFQDLQFELCDDISVINCTNKLCVLRCVLCIKTEIQKFCVPISSYKTDYATSSLMMTVEVYFKT